MTAALGKAARRNISYRFSCSSEKLLTSTCIFSLSSSSIFRFVLRSRIAAATAASRVSAAVRGLSGIAIAVADEAVGVPAAAAVALAPGAPLAAHVVAGVAVAVDAEIVLEMEGREGLDILIMMMETMSDTRQVMCSNE